MQDVDDLYDLPAEGVGLALHGEDPDDRAHPQEDRQPDSADERQRDPAHPPRQPGEAEGEAHPHLVAAERLELELGFAEVETRRLIDHQRAGLLQRDALRRPLQDFEERRAAVALEESAHDRLGELLGIAADDALAGLEGTGPIEVGRDEASVRKPTVVAGDATQPQRHDQRPQPHRQTDAHGGEEDEPGGFLGHGLPACLSAG